MLPRYKVTEYSTPSRRIKLIIVRDNSHKRKTLQRFILRLIRRIDKQKLLGLALATVGMVFCCIFPEDATAGVFVAFMGIARAVCND